MKRKSAAEKAEPWLELQNAEQAVVRATMAWFKFNSNGYLFNGNHVVTHLRLATRLENACARLAQIRSKK